MKYAKGSLVQARGREWIVLPESSEDFLLLRPLGGTDYEITGIHLALEEVKPASFQLPDPNQPGDYRSARLLRDAIRLGFRSSAGPFRSFGRINVEPRPYQLVPLLLALKHDTVRLLIADDVGIGKTIEACLIARELLDRGEVSRLAVLCPPHLAEQWERELSGKFHINAEVVVPGTAARLERACAVGQSLFDLYPFVIISTDFIKAERRREEFLRSCPELVIVDEAHTCAATGTGRSYRHQRYSLLAGLAKDKARHIILVTATPHSGKEEAFRSLLGLLNKSFESLPEDLAGKANEHHRRRLAAHLVQRRRADIRYYMQEATPFPEREDGEETYKLHPDYKALFDRALAYARQTVRGSDGVSHRQRVRWWSALALLRALASSPAAAAATLLTRAQVADTATVVEADDCGRRSVLDQDTEDLANISDVVPGAQADEYALSERDRRLLREMATQAQALEGAKDTKLLKALSLLEGFLKDGYSPLVFCRFIATAKYLEAELRARLGRKAEVIAVTGELAPAEREARIAELALVPAKVLIATDCLSEGINLQEHFDAVLHYDLSWNPTRHEQREGRVDRFGQPKPKTRVLTYYGLDNQIDGIVIDVLIRKHRQIRQSLGISVPVPVDPNAVAEAVFEGLLLRENNSHSAEQLTFLEPELQKGLAVQWEAAAEKEKRSRTMFAQEAIKPDEVARELAAMQDAVGSGVDVREFTLAALRMHKAKVKETKVVEVDLSESKRDFKDALPVPDKFSLAFAMPAPHGAMYASRMHPVVESLASYVATTALDPLLKGEAARCGLMRSGKVQKRTTALLVRLRYHIHSGRGREQTTTLAEECKVLAFSGSPSNAVWLTDSEAEALLQVEPTANTDILDQREGVGRIIAGLPQLEQAISEIAAARANELLEAHKRVRSAALLSSVSYRVEPQLPVDILGVYVYLPE
jgi:superfamily II DNA or RNA helicase